MACVNIHRVDNNCERCVVTREHGNLNITIDISFFFSRSTFHFYILWNCYKFMTILLNDTMYLINWYVTTITNDMQISYVKYNACKYVLVTRIQRLIFSLLKGYLRFMIRRIFNFINKISMIHSVILKHKIFHLKACDK